MHECKPMLCIGKHTMIENVIGDLREQVAERLFRELVSENLRR